MQKLLAGKVAWIKRKLHLTIAQAVLLQNETDLDILFEQEEVCDGSRPSLVLKIKGIIQRETEPERGVL